MPLHDIRIKSQGVCEGWTETETGPVRLRPDAETAGGLKLRARNKTIEVADSSSWLSPSPASQETAI